MRSNWVNKYGKGFKSAHNVVDGDLQPTQRLEEFRDLIEGSQIHKLLTELLMSDTCRRNFKEGQSISDGNCNDEVAKKKKAKLDLFYYQLERKKKISRFLIEMIYSERWTGKAPLTPMVESLTYLSSCGSTSNSFGRILSKLKVSKSIQTGNDTKKYVMDLTREKFNQDMLKSIHPTAGPNLHYWMVVGYDNYQKNKTVHLSSKVGGDSSFIQLIVGF